MKLPEHAQLMDDNHIEYDWSGRQYRCNLCKNAVLENWGCMSGHISGGKHNKNMRWYREPEMNMIEFIRNHPEMFPKNAEALAGLNGDTQLALLDKFNLENSLTPNGGDDSANREPPPTLSRGLHHL